MGELRRGRLEPDFRKRGLASCAGWVKEKTIAGRVERGPPGAVFWGAESGRAEEAEKKPSTKRTKGLFPDFLSCER